MDGILARQGYRRLVLIVWFTLLAACTKQAPPQQTAAEAKLEDVLVERAASTASTDSAFLTLNLAVPGFGGLYLHKDGTYRVMLTDATQVDHARPLIENFLRKVTAPGEGARDRSFKIAFVPATLTWFDLEDYKATLRDVVALPDVVYLDADESCNCITIAISSSGARPAVDRFVAAAGVPAASVRITLTSKIVMLQDLNDKFRPLKGGIKLKNDVGPFAFFGFAGICTVAAIADVGNMRGLVTNSHCTRVQGGIEGTLYFQNGTEPFRMDFVASEAVDPAWSPFPAGCPAGQRCRLSDSSFAELGSMITNSPGRVALPAARVCTLFPCATTMTSQADDVILTGLGGPPVVGTMLAKIGRTTGFTSGAVTTTCATVAQFLPTGTASGFTTLCQSIVAAASGSGDSGSPVISLPPGGATALSNGGRATLDGILWGGTPAGATATFVFSPIGAVVSELSGFGSETVSFFRTPPPQPPPQQPKNCQTQCERVRSACTQGVGSKGGPRPQQCALERGECLRECRPK